MNPLNNFPFNLTGVMMVATLLGAVLSPTQAKAEIVGRSPTKAGGYIYLMSEVGNCEAGKLMFTRAPDGRTSTGCWFVIGDFVMVKYSTGQTYSYDIYGFEPVKKETPPVKLEKPL